MTRDLLLVAACLSCCSLALAKTGVTLRTPEELRTLREQVRSTDWGKRAAESATARILGSYTSLTVKDAREKPEQFFWDLMYSTTIQREYYVHDRWQEAKGCPVHGTAIFTKGGGQLGGWSFDHDNHPWKLKCPVGGEYYPSNDFANGDLTSGDYPDDGSGWLHDGSRYYFIQVYAHYLYLGLICPAVNNLAQAYELTGDPEIGRRGAILLCKIAQEWPNSTTKRDRTYHPGYGAGAGMITDCDWSPGDFLNLTMDYDRLYDAFADPATVAFLQTVRPELTTTAAARHYIENEFLRPGAQACMDRVIQGNHGAAELAMATAALVLDDYSDVHPNSEDILHWVYYVAPGQVRYLAANLLLKDGGTTESPSYNTARLSFIPLLKRVEQLRKLHPDLVSESRYPSIVAHPKFRAMFDYFTDMVCLEKYLPDIGDMGGSRLANPVQTEGLSYGYLGGYALDGFGWFDDPKLAQVAYYGGNLPAGPGLDVDEELTTRAREAALREGPHIKRASQVMDGYKLAIMRDGQEDNQRALWTFYGSPLTHGHPDPLTIGLFAKGLDLLPGIGYPQSWKDAGVWEAHVMTANTVCVDQASRASYEGRMLGMVNTPVVQWLRLENDTQPGLEQFRRTLLLVPVGEADAYAVDLMEVAGGREHHLSYHGPQAPVTTGGLDLETQAHGTLAGEDVEFSQEYTDAGGHTRRDPFCQLTNVQRATPDAPWWVDYACGDTRDVHLRLHGLPESGAETILADGRGATHPEAYTVKFTLQHRLGFEPLRSRFITVLEPYEKQPLISAVRRQDLPDGGIAIEVTTPLGQDLIVLDAAATHTLGSPAVNVSAGLLSFVRRQGDRVTAMAVVGAGPLQAGESRLAMDAPTATGGITAVNRAAQTVDVDWQCPEPAALVGNLVRFHNDHRTCIYAITKAKWTPGGTRLTLDRSSLVGEGALTDAEDYLLHNSASFFYAGLGTDREGAPAPTYRLYVGATLEDETGATALPVMGITGGGYWGSPGDVLLDSKLAPQATADNLRRLITDANGDGQVGFGIYDYGVGDRFELIHAAAIAAGREATRLQATTKVDLSAPR